jgi:hypothetical protein
MSKSQRKAKKCKIYTGNSGQQPITQASLLRRALQWFANEDSFQDLPIHGNVGWMPFQLIRLAVLWAWSDCKTLTEAFKDARQLEVQLFNMPAVNSFQGLMGALQKYTAPLMELFLPHLHGRMEQAAGNYWRIGLWLALAVDGSRVTTPRTVSNEQAFSIKNYGRGGMTRSRAKWKNKRRRSKPLSERVKPQIWLTLIWHMGLKLPWSWRTGPSTASEREHLIAMLDSLKFPANTLFCFDAGFVGYDFWNAIQSAGHHFLGRVGANVRLLKKLGIVKHQSRDLVYLWPNEAARKKQPPLVLRLIEFQGARGPVFLVTNVLSEKKLSRRQAAELYRLRWGVELQFRALKQTYGRTKLRSRTSDNAINELHWSLVGLTLIQLFAVKEQIQIDSPPINSSVAVALAVIRDAMRNWSLVVHSSRELENKLQAATKDQYKRNRSKRARYRPRYKDEPRVTAPIIVLASLQQRRQYKMLRNAA